LANVDECTIKHHVKVYLLTSILVAMICSHCYTSSLLPWLWGRTQCHTNSCCKMAASDA